MPTDQPRIFIVEDDPSIATAVERGLLSRGFTAAHAEEFFNILPALTAFSPDLILLDITLPQYNGFYWCARIREQGGTPIIFLSARDDDMDIVMAMQLGGDDYITKPFSMEVLIAKIQAVLRRSNGAVPPARQEFCGASLAAAEGVLYVGEQKVELTKNESRILQELLEHRNAVVSREALMLRLWDSDLYIDDNTLTVNMNRLRKTLYEAGLPDCIATKRGEGYILHAE